MKSFYLTDGFQSRLIAVMGERNIDPFTLSNRSDVNLSNIEEFMSGFAAPRIACLEDMANVLGVSPAWLAFGQGEKQMPTDAEFATPYKDELILSVGELEARYKDVGAGEHPLFSHSGWISATVSKQTMLGYWAWVKEQLHDALDERP